MHPTRIFKTADELKAAWQGYKQNLDIEAKKWLKVQYVGKDGERVTDAQKLPYTLEGFKRYCRENHGEVEQYFSNKDGLYHDFVGICSHIREEIRENQITGGILGGRNLYWECEHWKTDGGCKDYRTQDMEKLAIKKLIQMYPGLIRKVSRKGSEFCIELEF